MEHPKDRGGLTRRQLLRGAAGSALGLSAAGFLAGCENTTEPIGVSAGGPAGPASRLVVPKPVGPGGLPLPRPDDAVTWAITADNRPIPEGRATERGPLRVYNYADYVDPVTVKKFQKEFGASVQIATYNSADEAIAKLAAGAVAFDVIIGLSGANIVNLIAQKLLQPLNHAYLPNLAKNVWPQLADPFYDRGSRYTVPYVVWMDGMAGGTTRSRRTSPRWTSPGTSSGTRRPTAARSGYWTTSAMRSPCRSSATRCAPAPGPT